jgi:hypothetical protein
MIEPLLLTTTHVRTFEQQQPLTNASGFFFQSEERLFLVTSRHVMIDEPSGHFPDRIEIELHVDPDNLAESIGFSILLYRDGKNIWRQGLDVAGEIDVAVIEIERAALPATTVFCAFTPNHLPGRFDQVEVGTSLLVVGFPLGFHDTLHHMPVVRHQDVSIGAFAVAHIDFVRNLFDPLPYRIECLQKSRFGSAYLGAQPFECVRFHAE